MTLPVNIFPKLSGKTHWLLGNLVGYLYLIFVLISYQLRIFLNKNYRTGGLNEIINIPHEWDDFWQKN